MKELGEYLKHTRIDNGVSMEEAAEDLELSTSQLENIESGNVRAFKDVYGLKQYVGRYAKYLGLNALEILDEFNEYMFEYTSKIPLKDIEKKVMEQNKEKTEVIASPYTKPMKKYPKKYYVIMCVIFIIVAILIICWSIQQIATTNYL